MQKHKPFEELLLWKIVIHAHRIFLALSSFTVVIAITASVILRYVLKTDLFGLEEIEILLAVWIYFIGGSYGSYARSHITADITSVVLKNPKTIRAFRILVSAIALGVSIFLTVWALQYMELIFMIGGRTPGLKIPLPLQRIPLVIGFFLMTLFNLYHFICDVMGRKPIIMDAEEDQRIEEGVA